MRISHCVPVRTYCTSIYGSRLIYKAINSRVQYCVSYKKLNTEVERTELKIHPTIVIRTYPNTYFRFSITNHFLLAICEDTMLPFLYLYVTKILQK